MEPTTDAELEESKGSSVGCTRSAAVMQSGSLARNLCLFKMWSLGSANGTLTHTTRERGGVAHRADTSLAQSLEIGHATRQCSAVCSLTDSKRGSCLTQRINYIHHLCCSASHSSLHQLSAGILDSSSLVSLSAAASTVATTAPTRAKARCIRKYRIGKGPPIGSAQRFCHAVFDLPSIISISRPTSYLGRRRFHPRNSRQDERFTQ